MRDGRFAKLAKYLQSVDSHVERNPEWLSPALDALRGCGVRNEFDLVGLERNATPSLPQGVHFAFSKRASEKANVPKIAKHAPSEGKNADSVTKLVKALRKEGTTVHVDITKNISDVTFAKLNHSLWPKSSIVDDMATAVKKLQKKRIKKPFLFSEWTSFPILGGREEERGGIVGGRFTCNQRVGQGCKGHVREGYCNEETHDDLAMADRFRQVRDCCPCDRPWISAPRNPTKMSSSNLLWARLPVGGARGLH